MMREIAEPGHGLWTFQQPLSVLGAEIGVRMTVVRLRDGGLFVHSPIRLTDAITRALDGLGEVRWVLAPNLDHYLFVLDFQAKYEGARFCAAPGVERKLPGALFDVSLRHPSLPDGLGDVLVPAWFRSSHELEELLLFHPSTRTLITADLAFNVQSTEGLLSHVMLRLNDSYGSFGPSRVCRSKITERRMARQDVDAILALNPERCIVSHGEILFGGATTALRDAYAWLR